jgi:hypothetical protein
MGFPTYPLPEFLKSTWTPLYYGGWLTRKANEARRHDHERKSPFAVNHSQKEYRHLIHEAMLAGNGMDPFIGDPLRFDLDPAYDSQKARGNIAYEKQFDLMPTVDHIDPESHVLALQICSWRINFCKSFQNPSDFIATCRKVVDYAGLPKPPRVFTSAQRWFLPSFLEGICTLAQYRRWLFSHANVLLSRDKKLMRPYALSGHMELYKEKLDAAAHHGMSDPFTGDILQWELINMWDPSKKDPSAHSVRQFRLLPTADHVDPASDVLDIEICSWFMNGCKGNLGPQEFVAICRKVADYATITSLNKRTSTPPPVLFLSFPLARL